MSTSITSQTKKLFDKVKKSVDQNIGRSEGSRQQNDDLHRTEARVKHLEKVLKQSKKKVAAGQISSSTSDNDKRLQKLPEYQLAQSFFELTNQLAASEFLLTSNLYREAGQAEYQLAKCRLQLELDVEEQFTSPLQSALDNDFPAVKRLMKQFEEQTSDRDSILHRLQAAQKAAVTAKEKPLQEDLEAADRKLDKTRDQLSSDLFGILSRESEFSQRMRDFLNAQLQYHERAAAALREVLPSLDNKLENHSSVPVFGQPLEEHLSRSGRPIASVIELCVCKLLNEGLEEEGILRVAGGASRVKRLRAAFDANSVDMTEFSTDIHAVSSVFKQYLRELPEPLMTFELYDEWCAAAKLQGEARLQTILAICKKLPKINYENLRYIIKFAAKVAEKSEVNKMTSSNLGLMLAPNILWKQTGGGELDVLGSQIHASVVETMISNDKYFFPEAVEFCSSHRSRAAAVRVKPAADLSSALGATARVALHGAGDIAFAMSETKSSDQHNKVSASNSDPDKPTETSVPQRSSHPEESFDSARKKSATLPPRPTALPPHPPGEKPVVKPAVGGRPVSDRKPSVGEKPSTGEKPTSPKPNVSAEKPKLYPNRPPAPTATEIALSESIRCEYTDNKPPPCSNINQAQPCSNDQHSNESINQPQPTNQKPADDTPPRLYPELPAAEPKSPRPARPPAPPRPKPPKPPTEPSSPS